MLKSWLFIIFVVFFMASVYSGYSLLSLKDAYMASPVAYSDFSEKKFLPEKITSAHLPVPDPLKAMYMTSWVAGTKGWREDLVKMAEATEINAFIIDVKDYTGRISFETSDPVLKEIGVSENRIPDVQEFISYLHEKNIYVIARISIFQDPFLTKKRPDLAVKTKQGAVWKDRKGLSWTDPASREVWDYNIRIAKEAERVGFDELNFDYIRFPSDGDMRDISYDFWDEVTPRADVLENFFEYLRYQLYDLGVPLSADLFGMTTWNNDDLNIGQILEYAAPYFDYLAPMVYPSHYPKTFQGYANPAEHPYEIVYLAMMRGSEKLLAASSSPSKLRPWLQDFDLGAVYDKDMVRKQMQAVYDAGLTSWMLWDPANKYTKDALNLAH